MNRYVLFLAGMLTASAAPVHAATPVDETRSMPADGRVQVDNLAGSIEITGWDRAEVHIIG